MKRAMLIAGLLVAAAGYVFLQTGAPRGSLAGMMPAGAMLCLESPDFASLLRDWDASKIKTDWLQSESYDVFERSNLFSKLQDVYKEYSEAAGFVPGLKSAIQIAGTESALALYEPRELEFLYISRLPQAQLAQSQLWAVRAKFEQRQAAGVTFYVHLDSGGKRTVAFATNKGFLLLATRDDLMAEALALMEGKSTDLSLASQDWYHNAVAEASKPGDLRLVMDMDSLIKSDHFRSYWIHRNISSLRQYSAAIADVNRSAATVTESRVFLRTAAPAESLNPAAAQAVAGLVSLVPPTAGLYKISSPVAADAAALLVRKLLAASGQRVANDRSAPDAVSPDDRAGAETDLETRIDEPPLPTDAGVPESVAAISSVLDARGLRALLQVQSSVPAGAFLQTPSVFVATGAGDWDAAAVRTALTAAVQPLWSTSGLGAGWTAAQVTRHAVERLDGLGSLWFAVRGPLLFFGNDAGLLASVLDRAGTAPAAVGATYTAGFRHARERENFTRLTGAIESVKAAQENAGNAPSFFSGNLASFSGALSRVSEVRMTEQDQGAKVTQTVVYQIGN